MSEIVHALGAKAPNRQTLRAALKSLTRTGQVVRADRDVYEVAPDGHVFEGTLRCSDGRFYVDDKHGEIEVPASALAGGLHGDRVRGQLTADGRVRYGVIDEVVEKHAPRRVVVEVVRARGLLLGDAAELGEPVQFPREWPVELVPGSRVTVVVEERKPLRRGRMRGVPSHVLTARHPGGGDTPRAARIDRAEMVRFIDPTEARASVVLEQLAPGLGADAPFPDDALAEVAAAAAPESVEEVDGRDVTEIPLATIDGADAKDFDDAVYAEQRGDGVIRLWVTVADVSSYVAQSGPLDDEARRRGCSVYLPGRVYPMLPPKLSDDICSLRPGVLRRCAWVWMDVAANGEIGAYDVGFGVMRSHARMTYAQVHEFLQGGPLDVPDPVRDSVRLLETVRQRRWAFRRARGTLDLDLPEPRVQLTDDGDDVVAVEPYPRWEANRLIEEAMLAANETIAGFLIERGWPTIYRVHGEPDPRKLQELRQRLRYTATRARVVADPTPEDLERILEEVAGTEDGPVLSRLVLRTLPRAEYGIARKGHYGLGTDQYLHFTSPIRRYPDLEVHRMVRRALAAGRAATSEEREVLVPRLTESAQLANRGEGIQTSAERASDRMMRALYMRDKVGERYEAVVSDVTRFGVFVSVTDPYVTGLVHISTLGADYFVFDERRFALIGERTGKAFRVGDRFEVVCVAVDVKEGQVSFEPTEAAEASSRRRAKRPKGGAAKGPRSPKPPPRSKKARRRRR